ncbi:TPA: hypothetical protein ACH3X1_011257 [Trebouxia sp. C0004]
MWTGYPTPLLCKVCRTCTGSEDTRYTDQHDGCPEDVSLLSKSWVGEVKLIQPTSLMEQIRHWAPADQAYINASFKSAGTGNCVAQEFCGDQARKCELYTRDDAVDSRGSQTMHRQV